jgi:cytidine deaminase
MDEEISYEGESTTGFAFFVPRKAAISGVRAQRGLLYRRSRRVGVDRVGIISYIDANTPSNIRKSMTDLELVAAAWEARQKACASYSHYAVGAALLTQAGDVYAGSNVESSSYGLSICAERVALFKALSSGDRGPFVRIAVVAEGSFVPVPCGACRQLLADYAEGIEILLSGKPGTFERVMLSDLLPRPFSSAFLR